MSACFHLAWRYVLRHRIQTLLLASALGVVLAIPFSIRLILSAAESAMHARAEATPQVIGARGSALDLLLTALYFKRQPLPPLPQSSLEEVRKTQSGRAIPLYIRFHAQEAPIVGTQLDYFAFRHLTLAQGRIFGRLGDCVVGSALAKNRDLSAGGSIFSSQEQVFDMAGIYPIKMRITGILNANGTADDHAVFVDLKTTWLIQGLAHGHDDLVSTDAVLTQESDNVVGNASVRMFNEVTDRNLSTFHFHGDALSYPLSAILVSPKNAKSEAILAGHYTKSENPAQLIRPLDEFNSLLGTLFQIETLTLTILGMLAFAALSVSALVFALSFRLRRTEFCTLADLGISHMALRLTKALEVVFIGLLALGIAAILVLSVWINAESVVTLLLRSSS